jgi:GNAT superfamily N-acetyltransferase
MPRRVRLADWQRLRDLRLRALADTPQAFAETLKEAQQLSDDEWKKRVAPSKESASFVEEADDRSLIGMAFGVCDASEEVVYLGGMFVDPARRGTGVGRRLVEAVESWARERGAQRIELEVNPEITPALRLYESCGYQPTGNMRQLPSHPSATAVEMAKPITPSR